MFSSCRSGPGASGRRCRSPWEGLCAEYYGAARFAMYWFSAPHHREGKAKIIIFGPFCTFWARLAITAPRRPKRTRHGPTAAWVPGNQPAGGLACGFGLLACQHVRWRAHMCPFQGPKSALGGRSNTRIVSRKSTLRYYDDENLQSTNKSRKKIARAQRDSNPQPPICVYISTPPATAPLHVGSRYRCRGIFFGNLLVV